MPEDRLLVSFTMNCAAVDRGAGYPGPSTWSAANKAAEGFADAVVSAGMKATMFVASDVCKRAVDALRACDKSGVEIGLLTDPRLEGFKGSLASYGIEHQKELISMGASTFTDALGREPKTFRPGEFSANNDTYIVLCELGFRQGSFSLPERHVVPECSNWRGAYPFAHHVDPLEVLQPGTLELYNVPVTSDFDKTTLNGQQDFTPLFLGSEQRDIDSAAAFLVSKHLKRMKSDNVHVKTLTCMSTNSANYADQTSHAAKMLAHIIDTIRRLADEQELALVPATLADIHEEADRLYKEGKHT